MKCLFQLVSVIYLCACAAEERLIPWNSASLNGANVFTVELGELLIFDPCGDSDGTNLIYTDSQEVFDDCISKGNVSSSDLYILIGTCVNNSWGILSLQMSFLDTLYFLSDYESECQMGLKATVKVVEKCGPPGLICTDPTERLTSSGDESTGSGDVNTTNEPTPDEGFVITTVDSKPAGKPIKLYVNNATLTPLKDQQVQKWRLTCPETLDNENLKLVFLLLHANLTDGDFLQFNKIRYEGYKSTPTVIDYDIDRDSFLVSHVTQEGNSDFDLRYVCPYSNFQNCTNFHHCPAVVNYVAETTEAYQSLAKLCYNPLSIHDGDQDQLLCQILKRASTCGLPVPHPLPSCE